MAISSRITPCLWFDTQGEDAANFYVGIFPNSRITTVARYPEGGKEQHGREPGSAMTVVFELDGVTFTALNGGPQFRFTEAVSFQVYCDSQQEIDHYWDALSAGGDPTAQQCGWLKDRFGLSWQIVPRNMGALFGGAGSEGTGRAMNAMLQMKKIDIAAIERARDGA